MRVHAMSTTRGWVWSALVAAALGLGLTGMVLAQHTPATEGVTLTGTVVDADGPVPGATVRVHTTQNGTVADASGIFTLTGVTAGEVVTVTAWAGSYFIG